MNISLKFNKFQMLNKCRICLESGACLIFSSYGEDNVDVRTVYETYTGIKVQEEDNMPKKLCISCLNDLMVTHDFIRKCKWADTVLRSLETVLVSNEPTDYKVVVIDGDNTIEFEYDSSDKPCVPMKDDVKYEYSEVLDKELAKIDCGQNELTINTFTSNESVMYQRDTIDVQKIYYDTDVKKECGDASLQDQTEMNINDDDLLNEFKTSWEDLINSNDEEYHTSNGSNDEKDMNDAESKALKNRVIKNIPKNKVCPVCSTGFKRKDTLINHMRTHTLEKPFKCNVCSAEFSSSCNLTRHSRVHTGEKPYVCDICGKAVTQSTSLKKHKELHTGKTKGRSPRHILCSYCGLTFTSNGKFKHHLIHTPGHIDLESEDARNKILSNFCKICGRYFDTKYTLNHHMAIHAGIKNYLCSYCGKKFQTKAALDIHSLLHTGERPYKCEICDKTFTQRGGLKFHRYIHTGAKPFKCTVCCKSFKQLAHLNYHSLLHTGEKRHACTYCGKLFTLKGNLKQHIAVHTDVTPYYCPICNRGFKNSNNMKKHLKIHIKEKRVT